MASAGALSAPKSSAEVTTAASVFLSLLKTAPPFSSLSLVRYPC
jgi:hypothetical protein